MSQIALVTGASRGIGKSIAQELGHSGHTVIGTATSEKGANAISAYLEEAGIQGRGVVLNVTDSEQVDSVIKTLSKDCGPIQILVNNAGITRDNLLMRMKDDEWNDIIDTNLTGTYRTSKACLRGMLKAKSGRIINISSIVGTMGNPGQSNYAAAKAGLMGFSKSLAREVASRGITVNVVAPGFIETDMTQGLAEDQREALLAQVPLGRLGQVEDIARMVNFLAGKGGSYITGQTLHINGGMLME